MNAHKSLGLLAAILVTTGQALVLAVDTAAVAQNAGPRGGYEVTLDARVPSPVHADFGAPAGSVVG